MHLLTGAEVNMVQTLVVNKTLVNSVYTFGRLRGNVHSKFKTCNALKVTFTNFRLHESYVVRH